MTSGNQIPNPPSKSGWNPPPFGSLKLNSNVAVRDDFPFVGMGAVIRDHKRDIATTISKHVQESFSAAIGEFLALREGLLLAKNLNLTIKFAEVDDVNIAHDINSLNPVICDAKLQMLNSL